MDFTNLKNYMNRLVNEYNTPGVDCIVYKDHEIIFRYYAGMSDIENNKKMTGNELYLTDKGTVLLSSFCLLYYIFA